MADDPAAGAEGHLHRYRFGSAEFDEATLQLRVDGVSVDIERRASQLLQVFLDRPRQILSRKELLLRVWETEHRSENIVSNAIAKIRIALRDEDGALLRSVPKQGYILDARVERTVTGARFHESLTLKPGVPVPGRESYLLKRRLGTTLQSEVWLAEQSETLEPAVFKFCSSAPRLAALKREYTLSRILRETLGPRDDFVKVNAANFSVQPYHLECEYGGQNLTEWADEDARLSSMPTSDRMALFAGIARAVADMHAVGLLHKDLKPSNILVARSSSAQDDTPRWITRVADLGSGLLLTEDLLEKLGITRHGFTTAVVRDSGAGTLAYIAPEVLEGRAASAQSDLYALGVMLYQLLAGDLRKPMTTGWEADIEDELLRADITAATHGRPDRRLPGVDALLERVGALAARREQAARAEAERRRAQEVQRRLQAAEARRPWVFAGTAALLVGIIGVSWQWRVASKEREAALAATARAEASQTYLVEDVLGGADPFAGSGTTPTTVRQAILDAGEQIDVRFAGQPGSAARLHAKLGALLHRYNEREAATRHWQAAIRLLSGTGNDAPEELVRAWLGHALTLSVSADPVKATAALASADSAWGQRQRSPALDAERGLVQTSILLNEMRITDAIPVALAAHRSALAADPPDIGLLDRTFAELSTIYENATKTDEAEALARDWLRSIDARAATPPSVRILAELRLTQSLVYGGKIDEAAPLAQAVVPKLIRSIGATAPLTITARNLLCELHSQRDDTRASYGCLRELVADIDKDPRVPRRTVLLLRGNTGILEHILGDYAGARQTIDGVLPDLRNLPGTEAIVSMLLFSALECDLRTGHHTKARERRAELDLARAQNADPYRPWAARLKVLDAMLAQSEGRMADARRLYREGVEAFEAKAREEQTTIQELLYDEAKAFLGKSAT